MPDIFDKIAAGEATGKELGAPAAPEQQEEGAAAAAAPEGVAATTAEGTTDEPQATPPASNGGAGDEPPAPAAAATVPVDHFKALVEQNKLLVEGVQKRLSEESARTQTLMDKMLQQERPEMTAAERAVKVQEAFNKLNEDPLAFLEGRDAKLKAEMLEEIRRDFAPKTAESELADFAAKQRQRLFQRQDGTVVRPELKDQSFWDLMLSEKVSNEVYEKYFPGQKPGDVLRNSEFYTEAFHVAKRFQAEDFAKTKEQSVKDQQAQQAVLKQHGDPVVGGKTPASGTPAKKTSGEQLRQDIVDMKSPMDSLRKAFK